MFSGIHSQDATIAPISLQSFILVCICGFNRLMSGTEGGTPSGRIRLALSSYAQMAPCSFFLLCVI